MIPDHQHVRTITAAQVLHDILQTEPSPHIRILGTHAAPHQWHRLQTRLLAHTHRPCLRRTHHTVRRRTKVPRSFIRDCRLTPHTTATRFRKHAINMFMIRLFERIPMLVAAAGLPPVTLSPFDLFHGHVFQSHQGAVLGMLLHCKEYPVRVWAGCSPSYTEPWHHHQTPRHAAMRFRMIWAFARRAAR